MLYLIYILLKKWFLCNNEEFEFDVLPNILKDKMTNCLTIFNKIIITERSLELLPITFSKSLPAHTERRGVENIGLGNSEEGWRAIGAGRKKTKRKGWVK